MRASVFGLFLLAGLAGASPAWAANPAGNAVDVVQQANGDLDGTTALLSTGDEVFMGQRVITGNAGRVQVVFSDQTHLVIGPGSSLVIDQYLMRNNGTASKFVVDVVGGTFRFITGNSPKNAYQIKTPTGTLGVRGTAFDFGVDRKTGETQVLLYHGGVNMCGKDGDCVLLTEACSVGLIPQHDQASIYGKNDRRRPPLLKSFPYLNSQWPLQADFRVGGTGSCKQSQPDEAPIVVKADLPVVPAPVPPSPPPHEPPPCPPPRHHHWNGWGEHHHHWSQHPGDWGGPGDGWHPHDGGDDVGYSVSTESSRSTPDEQSPAPHPNTDRDSNDHDSNHDNDRGRGDNSGGNGGNGGDQNHGADRNGPASGWNNSGNGGDRHHRH